MLKLAAHDLPDSETSLRAMRRGARELSERYPAISACRCELRSAAPRAGFEAHLELLLPQHQIIVNASAEAPERALADVLAKASTQLASLAQRDRSLARTRKETVDA